MSTSTWETHRGERTSGDKLLTLVASALAGGDFIDDADVKRTGGTDGAIGCVGQERQSTLGTFLRSFQWGHVRQVDSGEPGVAVPGLDQLVRDPAKDR